MDLMEYQLKQSLVNVESARKLIDKKRENEVDDGYLDNYHYELLDVELRLKDMLNNLHNIQQ